MNVSLPSFPKIVSLAGPSLQEVAAGLSAQCVLAFPAPERLPVMGADQDVVAVASEDGAVETHAFEDVVTGIPFDDRRPAVP